MISDYEYYLLYLFIVNYNNNRKKRRTNQCIKKSGITYPNTM